VQDVDRGASAWPPQPGAGAFTPAKKRPPTWQSGDTTDWLCLDLAVGTGSHRTQFGIYDMGGNVCNGLNWTPGNADSTAKYSRWFVVQGASS